MKTFADILRAEHIRCPPRKVRPVGNIRDGANRLAIRTTRRLLEIGAVALLIDSAGDAYLPIPHSSAHRWIEKREPQSLVGVYALSESNQFARRIEADIEEHMR